MFSKESNTNNQTEHLMRFISEAKRHGYLDNLKEINKSKKPTTDIDTFYRKKATSHYANKITKPFRLVDQPEYLKEKGFFSNFNSYIASTSEFQKIQQPTLTNPTRDAERVVDIYQQTLVCDPARDSHVSPQNLQKRIKRNKTVEVHDSLTQHTSFPTNVNYDEHTQIKFRRKSMTKRELSNGSPLNIHMQNTPSQRTPSVRKMNFSNRRLSIMKSLSSIDVIKTKQDINEEVALEQLNRLLGGEQKKRNYRISKPQLHELLKNRYGQDLITSFFEMQAIEDFNGIIKIALQLINSSTKLAQLIAFLTFDYNQDGILTQDQLTKISDLIDVTNPINSDIRTLITYSKQSDSTAVQADLPAYFIKHPTYKQYLKSNSMYKNQHADKIVGVMRLFSTRAEEQEDPRYEMKSLPSITRNNQFLNRKKIKINFADFRKAFKDQKPKLIESLIIYLVGDQSQPKSKRLETGREILSPQKYHLSSNTYKKKLNDHLKQQQKSNRQVQMERMVRVNQLLTTMKQHKSKLTTIHYT